MSREILFKAKRIYNGEWVEGFYTYCDGKYYIRLLTDENSQYVRSFFEVDASTICQYTGLTDKNGQKIWENDILSANLDESYPDDTTYAKVVWHKNGWQTQEKNSNDYDLMGIFDEENYVVVGNVFDNKELLEGGADEDKRKQ